MARGVQLTFLDLPGAADAGFSPADTYTPGLPAQRASDIDYFANQITPASVRQPRRSPLTFLDFFAPFAHFFSVLFAGKVLSLVAPFVPYLLPSTSFIDSAAHYLSLAALLYGFLRVFFRDYTGRFEKRLRPRPRLGRLGRRFLRRFGRRGWLVWYLTLPFWSGLFVGLLSAAFFVAGAFARGVWDYLTTPAPPPAPVRARINIFGESEEGILAKTLRSFMWAAKLLVAVAGSIFLFCGTINLMIDRPFIKYYMSAGMSFSILLMLWIVEATSQNATYYDFVDLAH
jgi:hypothetical protein